MFEFGNINADCKIYVPASLYDTWVAATNWSTWASYIVADSATASTSAAMVNEVGGVSYASLDINEQGVIAYIAHKDDENEEPEVILNKQDDYDTDTPPVINQTASV